MNRRNWKTVNSNSVVALEAVLQGTHVPKTAQANGPMGGNTGCISMLRSIDTKPMDVSMDRNIGDFRLAYNTQNRARDNSPIPRK
jgi:hypothetical protein